MRQSVLTDALRRILAVMGPKVPSCCGCEYEWSEALRIASEALAVHQSQAVAGGGAAASADAERGWLIERRAGPIGMKHYPARWWKGGGEPLTGEDCWTTDSNSAIRFCRAVDASTALMALRWRDKPTHTKRFNERVTITEHIWCGPAPSTASPPEHSEFDDNFERWFDSYVASGVGTPAPSAMYKIAKAAWKSAQVGAKP